MEIFAERLKELRIEAGLNQQELAKELGISDAAICRWESCKRIPNIENLVLIAKYFNVSADFLVGLEEY